MKQNTILKSVFFFFITDFVALTFEIEYHIQVFYSNGIACISHEVSVCHIWI